MSDEELDLGSEEQDEGQEPQAQATQPVQDAEYWRRQAEKQRRKLVRLTKFQELSREHPGLTFDDFEGIDIKHWERVAKRFASTPAATAAEQDAPESAPPAPSVPPAEQSDWQKFAKPSGTGATPDKISFEEAKRRGGLGNPEILAMARQGLIEGVKPPR